MDDTKELTFATWNLSCCLFRDCTHSGLPDPEPGQNYVVERLSDFETDIIALQEVLFPANGPSQAHVIAKNLGIDYIVEWPLSQSHLVSNSKIGIAILSRYPIESSEQFPFPNLKVSNQAGERSHDKGLLSVDINIDGYKCRFICGHLLPLHRFNIALDDQRSIEMFKLTDEILMSLISEPLVCGIDFNTNLDTQLLPKSLTRNQLRKLVHQPTRPEGETHDQILCCSRWETIFVRIYQSRFDHYLCIAKLRTFNIRSDQKRNMFQTETEIVRLLHLSDLHFGSRSKEDVDWKTFISNAERETRKDRLQAILELLDRKPDYVIISGDVTVAGRKDGFQSTHDFIDWLESNFNITRNNIVVVPGNHDVARTKNIMNPISQKDRWNDFHRYIGHRCIRPWLPSHDPDKEKIIDDLETSLRAAKENSIWGGFHCDTGETELRNSRPFPFVLNRKQKILIYAFNSASISGGHIEVDPKVSNAINALKSGEFRHNSDLSIVIEALDSERQIDAARIQPEEIGLFQRIMNTLRDTAPDEIEQILRIAVLHHHVVPYPLEEVKKFDLPTNAGRFIKELTEEKFQVIFHGHKHYPSIFSSSTPIEDKSQLVFSGGTVGGGEATGKKAGFHVIDYHPTSSFLESSFIELKEDGNPKNIVNNAQKNCALVIHTQGGFSPQTRQTQTLNLQELLQHTEKSLLRHLRHQKLEAKRIKVGWSHLLDHNHVSTIATAYGLRILNLTGLTQPRSRCAVDDAVATLLAMRNENDGGWTSSSQLIKNSQIEPTAFVILGLQHWVNENTLKSAGQALENLLDVDDDPVSGSHLYTISIAIQALLVANPSSPKIAKLVELIKSSAFFDERGHSCYWSSLAVTKAHNSFGQRSVRPSVLHTALAVLTLRQVHNATDGAMGATKSDLLSAINWIAQQDDWSNITEDINREHDDGLCTLVIKHFTATWAARAILISNEILITDRIQKLINELATGADQGLWNWGSVHHPIWATHDALETLKTYAFITAPYE